MENRPRPQEQAAQGGDAALRDFKEKIKSKGFTDDEVMSLAEKLAQEFAKDIEKEKGDNSLTQVRKFYNQVKVVQQQANAEKPDISAVKVKVRLLQAQAAYSVARKLLSGSFKEFFDAAAVKILSGGKEAMFEAVPGSEDDFEAGYRSLHDVAQERDVVLGLSVSGNAQYVIGAIEAARQNSWPRRIEQMSGLIERAMMKKKLDKERMWKENLLAFYRVARRKLSRLVISSSLLYLLLFYTPFIWFLAEPLKIVDLPEESDTIVVFAGGVGESGQARQGYEERVVYAVDLYKQGLADNLIFSSGYMYVFKEPLLMKALAISLGVPENAVILEDKARNTYENVDFVAKILGKKGWDKILLVSSPYHMRRASLVFNKVAKNIRVDYTPIPKSIFYSHEDRDSYGRKNWKRINLEQIKGMLHEYLGIVYYWWRGYI